MKRIACLLLSLVMAATILTGCGNWSTNSETSGENSTSQAKIRKRW